MAQHNSYGDSDAKCCFYRRSDRGKREVVCEAVALEAAIQIMRFGEVQAFDEHRKRYCNSLERCMSCPQYQALDLIKYGDD